MATRGSSQWAVRPFAVTCLAVSLATAFRLPVVARAGFPVYDGGMFTVMASELVSDHLALPRFTAYNGSEIPFVYPPLGLYVTALIHEATGLPILAIVQWLPFLLSLAVVAVVASLARMLLDSPRAAAIAAIAFPLFPYSAQWVIMGGGVTRAFGFLFSLLAVAALVRACRTPRIGSLLAPALATGAAIASHPEFGLLALVSAVFVPLLLAGGTRRLLVAGTASLGGLLLSAPWWATALARFGATPFLDAAASTSLSPEGLLSALAIFPFTAEPALHVLGVAGVLGALLLAASGRALIPVWLLLSLGLITRNGATPATVPLALAVGIALDELILPGAAAVSARSGRRWAAVAAPIVIGAWVFGYAVLENWLLLRNAGVLLPVLSEPERQLCGWVADHTPHDSVFLIVTSCSEVQRDPLVEWFPALSRRVSAVTPQGGEWIGRFGERAELAAGIKRCQGSGLRCILWQTAKGPRFTDILVGREPHGPLDVERLRSDLAHSPDYRVAFDGPGGTVFERRSLAPAPPAN